MVCSHNSNDFTKGGCVYKRPEGRKKERRRKLKGGRKEEKLMNGGSSNKFLVLQSPPSPTVSHRQIKRGPHQCLSRKVYTPSCYHCT